MTHYPALPFDDDPETPDAWTAVYATQGEGPHKQEIIKLRPHSAGMSLFDTWFFKSGLSLFVKLVSVQSGGMLAATWELPPTAPPAPPVSTRPPQINYGRLFSTYHVEVQGKTPPPWMPVGVLDDSTTTLILFPEPLTFTRAPAVFGLDQHGKPVLVQSHMWVPPAQAHQRGAVLAVHGIHPALELKDSTGLALRIVRGDVHAPLVQEHPHVAY